MVSAPGRRAQVAYAKRRGLSKRRACALLDVARSGLDHESVRDKQDEPVIARMRELAAQYPRYGYRRIRIFMERDGFKMSVDRAHRLWKKAKLQVPRKRRRRIATGRPRPTAPTAQNHVWAIDFVFDRCADGKQLKCLTVVDEWTRECLAIDVAGSLHSRRVIEVLAKLISVHGAPAHLRSDNGPEFVGKAILKWLVDEKIGSALNDPGKPWQNGTNESFNGTFRDECLNLEYFRSRPEAVVVIEAFRRHYNEVRPHSSLGYLTPQQFKQKQSPKQSTCERASSTELMVH